MTELTVTNSWSSRRGTAETNLIRNHEVAGSILSGLRIRGCCELWCRSQTWLGSGVAEALVKAGSCSSDWTPSLGTSIYHGRSPEKTKDEKKKKERKKRKKTKDERENIEVRSIRALGN